MGGKLPLSVTLIFVLMGLVVHITVEALFFKISIAARDYAAFAVWLALPPGVNLSAVFLVLAFLVLEVQVIGRLAGLFVLTSMTSIWFGVMMMLIVDFEESCCFWLLYLSVACVSRLGHFFAIHVYSAHLEALNDMSTGMRAESFRSTRAGSAGLSSLRRVNLRTTEVSAASSEGALQSSGV